MSAVTSLGPARADGGIIPVLNCGSSSVKFALFEAAGGQVPRQPLLRGKTDAVGSAASTYRDIRTAALALECDREQLGGRAFAAVSHRVLHGGDKYVALQAGALLLNSFDNTNPSEGKRSCP